MGLYRVDTKWLTTVSGLLTPGGMTHFAPKHHIGAGMALPCTVPNVLKQKAYQLEYSWNGSGHGEYFPK
jgi:hypothetical protein